MPSSQDHVAKKKTRKEEPKTKSEEENVELLAEDFPEFDPKLSSTLRENQNDVKKKECLPTTVKQLEERTEVIIFGN